MSEHTPRLTGYTEYEMITKNSEGEAEKHQLRANRYVIDEPESERSFLSTAAPTVIRPARVRPRQAKNRLLMDIPDIQFGYRRLPDGSLRPLHDPEALDLVLQISREEQPTDIILGGDELDFPELSRFPADSRHFIDTLQVSIDGLHTFLARLRAENPNARIRSLDSNHIRRLGSTMIKHAMPLFGVRQANLPDAWPVMTYPHLLRLEELGIQFDSGYPAVETVINDRLTAVHGDRSNARGSTASQYLNYRERSLLFHHTHRRESLERTTPSGKVISAFSFGHLTDNTGPVPHHGSSVSDKGEVISHTMNWQKGIGFVEYDEGDKPFQTRAVPFHEEASGLVAMLNGKEYRPRKEG